MTFGQNLKRIRKDMKLTQQEMGDKIGISQNYLSDIENGKRYLSIKAVTRLAQCLGISVTKLINDEIEV
ncbi:helix-turn-helix domain-containing protein [Mammaliicoccus sciuri]|uniref:helix-turn-helix domain-containing protein n=1 Tax=Mammaliicoccus sciuri TaxID=1296 RepID=UPI0021D2C7E6|nr:helix-turn-helix transcriptional regulator [Mammaliicoccus sciuri]UXU83307.1 helix-turn-helix domain-containing protein [Mammaliicoccus sciuri]UXU93154.1 helix-turn-helix domain-containing protein [Mammaliicoccus sciuri]UXV15104.1 helix-turn-helix domain-containing protein [Mammaliicoccus sciuri]UXV23367.1 helix-turn-helix domain-containing protein [Mammaliicoccus sciuri]UXV26145.1 helix-turn-helix domain-containing protein [Mammaliicoccus sciuri]